MFELERDFQKIGARVQVVRNGARTRRDALPFRVDLLSDRNGEVFDIRASADQQFLVVDARPRERHLLLLVRDGGLKHKFLCGHDERHWFVAAVPGASVKDVPSAKEALKPRLAMDEEIRRGLRSRERGRRRNRAWVRQGEWFFIPAPAMNPPAESVLKREPIRRGAGKPHRCEFLSRERGELVYVNRSNPNGLTEDQFAALCRRDPGARRRPWRLMTRNARVFVRGRVWHPDHATVLLEGWHRVEMNRESEAPAMRHVAFLD